MPEQISNSRIEEILRNSGKTIFVDDILPGIIGDKCSLSGPELADYYASLMAHAIMAPARPWRGIHHELNDHLLGAGLEPKLHRVSWQWSADAPQQALARQVMMREIASGAIAPGLEPTAQELRCLLQLLELVDLVETGNTAAAEMALSKALAEASRSDDNRQRYHLLVAASLLYTAKADLLSARAAAILAWVERSCMNKIGDPAPEFHLRTVTSAVSAGLAATDILDVLEPRKVELWLRQVRLADSLSSVAASILQRDQPDHFDSALGSLRGACETSPSYVDAVRATGFQCLGSGADVARAREAAATLYRIAPKSWYGPDLMSHVMERLGDLEGCLEHATLALTKAPTHGGLHARVGCVLLFLLDRADDALPHLQRATELWSDARAWHWYAARALDACPARSRLWLRRRRRCGSTAPTAYTANSASVLRTLRRRLERATAFRHRP